MRTFSFHKSFTDNHLALENISHNTLFLTGWIIYTRPPQP